MATILSYKALCSMSLITASEEEKPIPYYYIKAITLDYRFKDNIMPTLYAILDVEQDIYQALLDNCTDGYIDLAIQIYDVNSEMGIQKETLNSRFIYFIPTKYNYELDIKGVDLNDYDTSHIELGMIKAEMLYTNKKSFNGVYSLKSEKEQLGLPKGKIINEEASEEDEMITTEMLLNKILEEVPELYMDELEFNTEYEAFLLPPQQTVAKAIKYVFDRDPFYSTDYMFFMDFNKTYLVNTSGMAREVAKSTILFKIEDISSKAAYYTGMSKDQEDGTYIIYINQSDVNVSINTTSDKYYNQTVATYTDEVTIVDSNITTSEKETYNRQEIIQANELGAIIRKQAMDNTSVVINLFKMNMDASIITPDKQYIIDYDNYSNYNGKYLLLYKKEIIVRTGQNFDTTTMIGLQRIFGQDEEGAS